MDSTAPWHGLLLARGLGPVSAALDPAPLSHGGKPLTSTFLISIFNLTQQELWSILLMSLFGLGIWETFHNVAVIIIIGQLLEESGRLALLSLPSFLSQGNTGPIHSP